MKPEQVRIHIFELYETLCKRHQGAERWAQDSVHGGTVWYNKDSMLFVIECLDLLAKELGNV